MSAPSPFGNVVRGSLLPALVLAVSSCDGENLGGPDAQEVGSIEVIVRTSAATAEAALDSDGYMVVLPDGGALTVGVEGTVTFTDVRAGTYPVELQDVQDNCTTALNPVTAIVVAGGTTPVIFQVTCWPPTSGRIAFVSDRDLGMDTLSTFRSESKIFTMNADGSDVVQVTGDNAFWPAWSPDGSRIAFTLAGRPGTGSEDIFVVHSWGGVPTQVTSDPLPEEAPAWSPDGSRIAFSRYTPPVWGPEDIYVVNADGTGAEVRLTNHPSRDFLPAWSPDGTRIAFTTDRDGNEEVYVMNADGSNPVNLTNHPGSDVVWAGAWSPDGTRIVFQTNREGDSDVFVMNADGTDPVNLTNSPMQEKGGSWSPDGTKVVFWQDPAGDVCIVNSDGTGMVDITNSVFLDRYPNWSPSTGELGPKGPGAPGPKPPGTR